MNSLLRLSLATFMLFGAACSDENGIVSDSGADMALADKGPGADKAMSETSTGDAAGDATGDVGADVGADLTPDISPDTGPVENSNWKEVKYGLPSPLLRIGGTSASNIYAVGKLGTIMKSDGSTWTSMTNPDTSKSTLTTLWLNSSASYWYALGDGIILYYYGGKWNKGYSSSYSNYSHNDMWAAKDPTVWSVGDGGMIYRKTSGSPSSNFSYVYYSGIGGKEDFKGIWGTSDTNIWVVGSKGAIYHCTSSCTTSAGWKKISSGTTWNLTDIHGFSASDIWACGYNGTVLQYDGTSWKVHQLPTKSYLHSIWGTSKSNLYVVGHPHFKQDESAFHYNGTKWSKISPPRASYLNGIWGDSSGKTIYAVGDYNILKWKGTTP